MRIDVQKMELAMARACVGITDLRGVLSSATLAKIRYRPDQRLKPQTVGKIAKALNVDPSELLETEAVDYEQ